ncbi:asparagine synthetase B family protein [Pseudothauera rhizosphaerae]|uniref:asparagine synthase (glutamine-hydrolyzing) n=1 Tax=Pseudothauera rhizosphaerae TaxID=2565932 RepID=A0A4S4API5_9RHOO|nr:asparagine synthase C-terminal domain-containing protein [Pseudothauera rhizosphaerae]THF61603.1 asparagine synthase [Pseudothauera rhizosphaerae]
MLEQFSGILYGDTPAPDAAAPSPQVARLDFPGGTLAFRPGVTVFEDGGDLCLALGTPRFDDTALQQTNLQHGAAAAWAQAFRRHGDEALQQVRGRFCVVLIRAGGREALLATDRFSTWPICYGEQDGRLAFSDRADTLPGIPRRVSSQAVLEYLFFHMIPAPTTIFAGVSRLPAGHLLKWRNGEAECVRWWQPVFEEHTAHGFDDAKARFLQIVEDSVRREAEGANVGCFLSGGTDSSTVTGMLCKVWGEPARSYSIGFDASGYDEMEYARLAARRFGADHQEYYVTPDDLVAGIPRVATHYDQPFGNSSALPGWICATRAREDGIGKMLAGDGGDELFGGNSRYAKQRIFGWYEGIPGPLRRGLLEPALALPGMDRIPVVKKGVSYVEQARVPMPDRIHMYNMLVRLGTDTVFEPDFLARVDIGSPARGQRAVWASTAARSHINRMLHYDWKYTLADNDLPKVIGTTGLAGIDVAFPLLSDELTDFSLTLPPAWKLKGLTLRWFFKEALRGFLPDEIIAKKKHGFGLPFGVWACRHAPLKALAADALGGFKGRGIVRPAFVDELLSTHLPAHPGYYGEMVWIMMMMEFWLRGHETNGPLPWTTPSP